MTHTTNLESRMNVYLLVYKIVNQRMICGGHQDCASVRNKLETETQKRIHRLSQLQGISEVEAAQSLYDLYSEKIASQRLSWSGKKLAPRRVALPVG